MARALAPGDRVVARGRPYDDVETSWAASFATVRDGVVAGLTEVWTDTAAQT